MSQADVEILKNRGKRLTKPQKFALLRLLFKWENAEMLAESKNPTRDARELLLTRYGLDIPYTTLYGLNHRWICVYDANTKEIKEIVRGRFNAYGSYEPPKKRKF